MTQVLDHGFVHLIDKMGTDLTSVNAARISMGKRKGELDEKDERLIAFLGEQGHHAPMRHIQLTFHVKAPLFVFRQWFKHRIGSDFNELSGRYVDLSEVDIHVPDVFRAHSKDVKQGSVGVVEDQVEAASVYHTSCLFALHQYRKLIAAGVCREQARMVLPLAMYSEVYWTASLQAVCHFIKLREDSHAQKEIQEYAKVVKDIALYYFPHSTRALLGEKDV